MRLHAVIPLSLAIVLSPLPVTSQTVAFTEGARSPAYAADGRIAVTLRGDLWVIPAGGGTAVRTTAGPAWDRSPAWTADGEWIVFASDRAGGNVDVWRVRVDPSGRALGDPERLTDGGGPEDEPSVLPDGGIVFVRGRWGSADLWLRRADGGEVRLTSEVGAEVAPAVSPDGRRIAYVAERSGERRLRLATLEDGALTGETAVYEDQEADAPAWSPDGQRIAFAAPARRGFGPAARSDSASIYAADAGGGWLQQVAAGAGVPVWAPAGTAILVAAVDAAEPGYNGDPARLADRGADIHATATGDLRLVSVPSWPGAATRTVSFTATVDRATFNADAFDRVWDRVARLYFGHDRLNSSGEVAVANGTVAAVSPSAASMGGEDAERALRAWRSARERHRPRALAAASDGELNDVLHALVRDRPQLRTAGAGRAGVSSAHPLASAAGAEILAAGGNVVDAAIATSFALGVVEPDASGPGGYGEMVLWLRGMDEPVAIEFMTRVPEHAGLDNRALDHLPPDGPMLALVPGPVAGMGLAFEKYGSGNVSWARILEPAIRLAEDGFPVSDGFATTLEREREAFERWESSRELFFDDAGEPLAAGATLRNPDLAWMLGELAANGWQAFYTGEPAQRLVDDLRSHGHPITMHDMARYFAKERAPVVTTYRGHTVYSGPPPVTGGALLAAKLNLLERVPAGSGIIDDAAKLHAMIEAWKLQPSTSGRIADPDSWPVDITPFESKDTAALRWQCFDAGRASTSERCERTSSAPQDEPAAVGLLGSAAGPDVHGPGAPLRGTGTTAFAVADAEGNMVAVTQTLGTWGGNFYVTPGLGFLYNDKMRSHGTDPARYNARIPYARTGTVIAPTLVFRGTGADRQPLLAAGAAGNAWITSAVYQVVVGVIDHGMSPQEALDMPRFLPGGGAISVEAGLSPAAVRRLSEIGHRFTPISLLGEVRMGYGAAVLVQGDRVLVGGDARRGGGVAVVDPK